MAEGNLWSEDGCVPPQSGFIPDLADEDCDEDSGGRLRYDEDGFLSMCSAETGEWDILARSSGYTAGLDQNSPAASCSEIYEASGLCKRKIL